MIDERGIAMRYAFFYFIAKSDVAYDEQTRTRVYAEVNQLETNWEVDSPSRERRVVANLHSTRDLPRCR